MEGQKRAFFLRKNEEGATASEYAILLATIAMTVFFATQLLGRNVLTQFSNTEKQFQSETYSPSPSSSPGAGAPGGNGGGSGGGAESGANSGGNYEGGKGDSKNGSGKVNKTGGRHGQKGLNPV